MQIAINKKTAIHIIAFVWIIFSIIYTVYDIWGDFKLKELNQAYQQGRTDTINTLIEQASQCNAIPVSSGTTTISVVNVDCLKAAASEK